MVNRKDLLFEAIKSAFMAGNVIMDIYNNHDFNIEYKEDESPLTIADKKANEIIYSQLSPFTIPILSEEGRHMPFKERKSWEVFWLIDPLDGTKEIIKRNGEFTINIALIEKNIPVLGVIYAPVLDDLYFAEEYLGSIKITQFHTKFDMANPGIEPLLNAGTALPLTDISKESFTVVGSRSHMSEETESYINQLKQKHRNLNIISKGSSLKLCLVAEGNADEYPRFGPTMEWDTAAGHAIARFSGCSVLRRDNDASLTYNKEKLLNPYFIVRRD